MPFLFPFYFNLTIAPDTGRGTEQARKRQRGWEGLIGQRRSGLRARAVGRGSHGMGGLSDENGREMNGFGRGRGRRRGRKRL